MWKNALERAIAFLIVVVAVPAMFGLTVIAGIGAIAFWVAWFLMVFCAACMWLCEVVILGVVPNFCEKLDDICDDLKVNKFRE